MDAGTLSQPWLQYFVEVSVLFGQDELRARVPVRIS